ncbi:MAG: phosphatase PAP2 family protein [Rhodoferax sp.]|nr:phosphatase PAP2 family protein [Rhodoferax sp.]
MSRSALVGPYQGATLPVHLPVPLDKPDRLSHWEAGPRLAVCEQALMAGLHFAVNQGRESVAVHFVDLDKKPLKDYALVNLRRPTADIFKQQLRLVVDYAELRGDRGAEILAEIGPQTAFWGSIVGLHDHRHKYTLELVSLVLTLAIQIEMRFKAAFACQRPDDLSPQIQPMIPTPGHGSWPSGHATEAFAIATVLQALLPKGEKYKEQLERQAARIAVNRTVAGLHFPVDSAVGRLLGTALAEFIVARCNGGKLHERGFDGTKFHGSAGQVIDFDLRVSMTDNHSKYYQYGALTSTIAASPILAFMWAKAAKEWQPLK